MKSRLYIIGLMLFISMFFIQNVSAMERYGETLCEKPEYHCIRIERGETWETLFPELEQQDIVRRVNRMNVSLRPGMVIAVPRHLDDTSIFDVAPFPRYIDATGEKIIVVNQQELAWAAYDEQGEMVWWGPISSGSGTCKYIDGHCETPSGLFRIIRKQDYDCISTVFPTNEDGTQGGAEMPYCMHFFRGYALHGSDTVPGYRASHGCIRLFTEDARWLNEEFIDLPGAGGYKGTRVLIEAPKTRH